MEKLKNLSTTHLKYVTLYIYITIILFIALYSSKTLFINILGMSANDIFNLVIAIAAILNIWILVLFQRDNQSKLIKMEKSKLHIEWVQSILLNDDNMTIVNEYFKFIKQSLNESSSIDEFWREYGSYEDAIRHDFVYFSNTINDELFKKLSSNLRCMEDEVLSEFSGIFANKTSNLAKINELNRKILKLKNDFFSIIVEWELGTIDNT